MKAEKPYTPQNDGWFVPDARMMEMMDAIDKKVLEIKSK